MCVTVCVCQCVWVCGDWEWNTHMAANYRWAASQTWSSWQAHTQTDREREREKKRGSTRSLSYCNHAELWIQERPIRWGKLAPDKTTPVSFWPCHNYKAVTPTCPMCIPHSCLFDWCQGTICVLFLVNRYLHTYSEAFVRCEMPPFDFHHSVMHGQSKSMIVVRLKKRRGLAGIHWWGSAKGEEHSLCKHVAIGAILQHHFQHKRPSRCSPVQFHAFGYFLSPRTSL